MYDTNLKTAYKRLLFISVFSAGTPIYRGRDILGWGKDLYNS